MCRIRLTWVLSLLLIQSGVQPISAQNAHPPLSLGGPPPINDMSMAAAAITAADLAALRDAIVAADGWRGWGRGLRSGDVRRPRGRVRWLAAEPVEFLVDRRFAQLEPVVEIPQPGAGQGTRGGAKHARREITARPLQGRTDDPARRRRFGAALRGCHDVWRPQGSVGRSSTLTEADRQSGDRLRIKERRPRA